MKQFSKPKTEAFILTPNMAEAFLKTKHPTSSDALARVERCLAKSSSNKGFTNNNVR